jgi:hypothetical protein
MKYRDGRRILVGRDCARKIWGVDFDLLVRDFDAAKDLAHYLKRRNEMRAVAPDFLAALALLRKDASLGQYQNLKIEFRKRLANLAPILDDIIDRQQGTLYVDDRVRDFAAEARRVVKDDEEAAPITLARRALQDMGIRADEATNDENKKKKQLDPIYTTIRRSLGVIAGQEFFRGGEDPVGLRLLHFEQRATATIGLLQGEHDRSVTLQQRLKSLTEIVDDIIGEIDRLEGLVAVFEAGNLSCLVEWANNTSKDGTTYRQTTTGIVIEPDRADPIVVDFPSDYHVPSREPFKRFKAIIKG